MAERRVVRHVIGGADVGGKLSEDRINKAASPLRQAEHLRAWAEINIKPKHPELFRRIVSEIGGLRAAIVNDDIVAAADTALNISYSTMRLLAERGYNSTNANLSGRSRKLPSDTGDIEAEIDRLYQKNSALTITALRLMAGKKWGVGRTAIANRTKYNPIRK